MSPPSPPATVVEALAAPLEAVDFDRIFSDDPVRDVLAWMSDPEAVRSGWEAGRRRAFAFRCMADLGFDPEKDGELVAAERLGRREDAPRGRRRRAPGAVRLRAGRRPPPGGEEEIR